MIRYRFWWSTSNSESPWPWLLVYYVTKRPASWHLHDGPNFRVLVKHDYQLLSLYISPPVPCFYECNKNRWNWGDVAFLFWETMRNSLFKLPSNKGVPDDRWSRQYALEQENCGGLLRTTIFGKQYWIRMESTFDPIKCKNHDLSTSFVNIDNPAVL